MVYTPAVIADTGYDNANAPAPPATVALWVTPLIVTATVSPSAGYTEPGALTVPDNATLAVPYGTLWLAETPLIEGAAFSHSIIMALR